MEDVAPTARDRGSPGSRSLMIGRAPRAEPPGTVVALLEHQSRQNPERVAVLGVDPRSTLTYAQLRDQVFGLATDLVESGIGRNDVIAVSMPAGPQALVAVLGAIVAGVCAPLNPAYRRSEARRYVEVSGAAAIVVDRTALAEDSTWWSQTEVPAVTLGRRESSAPGRPPSEVDRALLLHTAGTTALPKHVPLSHANLMAAGRNVVQSLALTPEDRCLNVMPLFHSHGLLGAALSSLVAGGSVVCTPPIDPRLLMDWARDTNATWYTAAPTMHRLFLTSPGEWHGFRLLRSASAPLPPTLADELERRFEAPMIEVYGMTEAYQIAANPLPPGERRRGSVGRPTGTEVALLDASGLVRRHGEGEVVVRGGAVFDGYSFPADANDEAFVDSWFRTGDLGRIEDDGYLTLTGRVKEQINKAGEKVSPREIEEVLLQHPGVVDACVFGVPDRDKGEDVACAVVPAPGEEVDAGDLRTYVGDRLAAFKVPRYVLTVNDIARSDTGKPRRRELAQQVARELAADAPNHGLSDGAGSVEQRLARMWQDVLRLGKPPDSTDSFFELGGDSLAVMELIVRIGGTFGVDLPLMEVHAVPTLRQLAHRIEHDSVEDDGRNLRLYRKGESGVSLVLVPGQFGLAVGLNRIADAVDSDASIYFFDYPGQREGTSPLESVEGLAGSLIEELENLPSDALVLYGNSMGSWVVLEAARQLEAAGQGPSLVAIGDMYSPVFNVSTLRGRLDPRVVARFVRARAAALVRTARALRGQGESDSPAVERAAAVQRGSNRARRAYRAQHYGGNLLVVATRDRAAKYGETLGYARHVTGEVTAVVVSGEHDTMHVSQAVPIGQALARAVDRVGAEPRPKGEMDAGTR